MLGKLKKTTSQKCPDCGRPLQLRTFGIRDVNEQRVEEDEYLVCSALCGYSQKITPEKRRKKREKEVDDI